MLRTGTVAFDKIKEVSRPPVVLELPIVKTEPVTDVGFFSKLKDVVSDVGKTIAYSVAAPVNSITGHKYKPQYDTNVGKVLGTGSNIGIASLHAAPKAFLNTLTAGKATELTNKWRKEENKEKPFEFGGFLTEGNETGVKFIDKGMQALEKVSKGGAIVIGQAMGVKALAGGAEKILQKNKPPVEGEEKQGTISTSNAIGIAALAIGAAIAFK